MNNSDTYESCEYRKIENSYFDPFLFHFVTFQH